MTIFLTVHWLLQIINASNVWNRFNKKIKEKDSNSNIKTMIISAYLKDFLQDISYLQTIDKIFEKPVNVNTLKNEIINLTNDKIHRENSSY